MRSVISFCLVALCIMLSSFAEASISNVYVQPAGDVVSGRYWGYFGSGTWSDTTANPNTVYHSYYPGDGNSVGTTLIFDTSSIASLLPSDILSAYLNINILNIWTENRDDVGTISAGGSVLYSEGIGRKSYDITQYFKDHLASTITLGISYTGYSGFTFGSADGGDPAFLSITTASAPVPIPGAALLLGSGLLGLVGLKRRKTA